MDNITLYTLKPDMLSADQMEDLADDGSVTLHTPTEIQIAWNDVKITMYPMQAGDELAEHLNGFQGFVAHHAGDAVEEMQGLIDLIGDVQLSFGCEVEPRFDRGNKVKNFLINLAATYEQALFFHDNAILSPFGEVWFGPEASQPLVDLSELKVRKLAMEDFPTMSASQQERHSRIGKLLANYGVPEIMKRSWVDDDESESVRTAEEVARRVLALHAVVCIARGRPRDETIAELQAAGCEHDLTPDEMLFLDQDPIPEGERQGMIWKLECLWLLMWSLRHIDKFKWPNEMCDVDGLHELIFEKSKNSAAFIRDASLRSRKSILDATQIIVQLHAVIRTAYVDDAEIPENLNWKKPSGLLPATQSPVCGIVAERHYALNWLRCLDDWDDVDTPTVPYAILED